ncbi:uncharacterized protein FOMMEDRAFT_153019 [Fomitiporia mediterranea MF3/22]|uniref:uncharacterized protein n=1 Tax=Fomitiporia mediterranea (strain MF3/22) TaxID=694068 RepID=UPI0004408E85|nr:uncharacterized protein FOMMEDRAFT_153019 [Fomitiporia mediterranea MF3/22]EJD05685.1 hypothetical protein FOMMEDRAFT_153019 [Fomitiporia mediterranea MF3/22]
MSSEDELATYDATSTPYRVEIYEDVKRKRANGRTAVAGPSSKPASKTRSNTQKRTPTPEDDDEGARASDDAAAIVVDPPAPARKRGRPKRAASREPERPGNSKAARSIREKGKGKARDDDVREPSPEVMDIDNLEEIRADEEDEPQETSRPPTQSWNLKGNRQDGESAAWKKREEKLRREIERLQKRYQDVQMQRDNLANELEETFQVRNTEAELHTEQQAAVYESRLQTQEEMIQELTSQLARVDALTREGKTSTLHFLTREAADEERRGVERQVEKLKQALKEKDRVIGEKDATIDGQAGEIRELRRELAAEIERSKTLASSRPNGREALPRSRIVSGPSSGVKLDGVKATNAHKLYEDLTNILILDLRCEISADTNEEQWVYSCLYSHSGTDWSLAFSLRTYFEIGEDGESVEKVAYTPKEMSDKSPESLEKLDFLAEEFTFHRKQLDVFLDKLYTVMNEAFGSAEI